MVNLVMVEAAESITDRNIDLLADTLKLMLVTATYVPDKDNQFIDAGGASDPVDARAAGTTDQTIASKVIGKDTTGDFAYLDGADSTFVAVPAGAAIVGCVLYKDTGVATTSKIICYYDITDITPNGGDIVIQYATPANGGMLKLAA
jgi:hypothetical protein